MEEKSDQTVDLSTLVKRAAEDSYLSLKELVEKSRTDELSDYDKKIGLLKFLNKTQQRMLRLNVLSKWCQQVPLIQHCEQLSSTLSNHEMCFTQAADSLFFMHEGLQQARAPIYDVPSAVEILLTGNYQRLPKCVEDVGGQSSLKEDEQQAALKKLDTLVRSKLLEVTIPKEISEIKVYNGTATLRVDGEFKVLVTLGYRGHMSMWRILHMELLVGERSGLVKMEESRRYSLGDDLERRMAAAENPFVTLYSVLHELCVAIVMDTVIRQVRSLLLGRWKDAIRFELLSDASSGQGGGAGSSQMSQDGETDSSVLRTPGLKLFYWLDPDRSSGSVDSVSCPYIKIEPGSDVQIKCFHSSFLIDPLTGREAKLSVDQSSIDVEKLLLRTICCNRYTRLLEIYKELVKNSQICRAAGDVVLQCYTDEPDDTKKDNKTHAHQYEGQEVLRVRAYGSSFFTLGINIRNGRYVLHSARNVLTPQALQECEEALNQGTMTAAEVFTILRSKSILHLFACIGNFIGLQVYEHSFAAVEVPKNMLNGQGKVLMGFPDCGSSYFLLMQLDKDFKPLVKLLETDSHPSANTHSFGDLNNVVRVKDIDIGQIKVLEDELNLSLLDCGKILSRSPSYLGANQASEHGLLSELGTEGCALTSGGHPTSFSSVVDEVFDLDRGSSVISFPGQSLSSSFNTSASTHADTVPMGLRSMKAGAQTSHINTVPNVSSGSPHYGGPLSSSGNLKGMMQSSSVNSLSSGSVRSSTVKKLSASKSDQDLTTLRTPHSVDSTAMMDKVQLTASALLSPPRLTALSVLPRAQGQDMPVAPNLTLDAGTSSRKRRVSDMLTSIPSLQCLEVLTESCKRRKMTDSGIGQQFISVDLIGKTEGYSYASLVTEANKGNAPSGVYISVLLHVVRHCSLCIKHARLTSQMDALEIPYVEEVGLRNASSNLWFRVPFARGNTWQHICLRLGQAGSMYWDVKINDQHFMDLWELQKGGNTTPWASGVRIANTSDIDSHIRYDPEGVVLSYHSVEDDSIKKVVADIQRLYNARMFALGMQKLLGVKPDDSKLEEGGVNSDVKVSDGEKSATEAADKLSEQMRRAFRIEAVGLMSLWFSFGSSVLARFVVEWESGKDGCTMHVSPDQLWPHTKFLEDFINGAEVASLLDCIRLTAGPLHALAAAIRPARAGPTPGVPSVASALPSSGKQSGYPQSPGPLHNNSQAAPGPGVNPVAPAAMGSLPNHNLHGAATLAAAAAAGRGGPGLVPSSLLPIDVSVVLRGPYWVRIIYRKNFAVDMRCFAGDQVWLQPATPPKGGPSAGGSLPCPQFRPFIMEHVAQELNGLEPNFSGGQQPNGMTNVSSPNQTLASGANRGNFPISGGLSRPGNQVAGLNRIGNALSTSSNFSAVSAGLPVRRTPGAGVPAHLRGELNTAIIGLGDDGGYGGGWVPLVALKKVLRGILKYLGVLWLFAQLPELLKEILGSILKDNEGALLNLDQEQPALRFFVGGYVFAVSVHRVQLLLQVLSVKRFHHSQQQQPNSATTQEELTQSEIGEICDYFSRRVASEPYDASRVASFITLLTLPISVIREFLKLIAWKKGLAQVQGGDTAPAQKPRIELCLENHAGLNMDGNSKNLSATKSNIHHDRPHNCVDFALTVVLDPTHIPHINAAGGAAWLPHCVSVRLKYSFGENPSVVYLGMEGSHGGQACWLRSEDWEKCKQRVSRIVEVSGSSSGDGSQGRLRVVADNIQRALQMCLQALRDGSGTTTSTVPAS